MLVEVLLEFLIGIVDVKLLKPIHLEVERHIFRSVSGLHVCERASSETVQSSHLKVLKAENVKDADGLEVFLPFDLLIDLEDDPGETLGI